MDEIRLRGVRVHNLQSVDLDIPYKNLVVFCGVSGSGKSSLAMDTLYAEGQRRYIESFSAYTRQYLEKLEKPEADHIEGIPPAAAVTVRNANYFTRATIGTSTETVYYLRLLFSKIGKLFCQKCGREVRYDSPESILDFLLDFLKKQPADASSEQKLIIAFEPPSEAFEQTRDEFQAQFQEAGFIRGLLFGQNFRIDESGISEEDYQKLQAFFGVSSEVKTSKTQTDAKKSGKTSKKAASSKETAKEEKDLFSDQDFLDPISEKVDEPTLEEEDFPTPPLSLSSAPTPEEDAELDSPFDAELDESKNTLLFISGSQFENDFPTAESLKSNENQTNTESESEPTSPPILFYVDRVVLGKTEEQRILDSLETALQFGEERCFTLLGDGGWGMGDGGLGNANHKPQTPNPKPPFFGFSRLLSCEDCRISYPRIEPNLFSFNSPLGACPVCEGFGNLIMFDLDLIIPNKNRSLKDGAIAPWNTPSYKARLNELLQRSEELGIPVDVPFENLTQEQKNIIIYGREKTKKGEKKYEGLSQFFEKLQKQKYKMHIRVFLSRWRSYRKCPACSGSRLRPEALAVKIRGYSIADFCEMPISELIPLFESFSWNPWEHEIAKTAIHQSLNRLKYLDEVGLGYLNLNRTLRTLSSGEQRRVCLTSALGSSLVNMLYVLDEPSIGLHPQDTDRLLESIRGLRDRGNTVVVVEHEESILRSADQIVEIGPGAGLGGGKLVFQGTPEEIEKSESSLTGGYLSGKRNSGVLGKQRRPHHGSLELIGASGRNLKNINVVFPLGVLCVITGVSGAGKSSLVQETLFPALWNKLGRDRIASGLPYTQILGTGQIDDAVMVDQSVIGRSPRSNPATYLKIFDDIRNVFAETLDAKTKNFTAGRFSFNVEGGRCNTCKGDGFISIDMQFMADMYVKCPQCHGKRYQNDVLEIMYRGKNIADVLDMTAREAFTFFRGQAKVQQKLKRLMDVGLDYLKLGQPANTLSGGESQRLKLATYLSSMKRGHCVFLLDEPTTGLHFSDVVQLLDCFDALLDTGHSLIVVEHNLQMMRAADYIIDLGPGPAEKGGTVVVAGTPEEIAKCPNSLTGKFLA